MIAPGHVIAGQYRVERILGEGGFGVVVAAIHVQLGQRVALKFLLPQAFRDPAILERFVREDRAMASITSHHIARVIDDHRSDRRQRRAAGAGLHIDPSTLDPKAVADYAAKAHEQTLIGFLSSIIPSTPLAALASGDILQVLFFSVLFGIALALVGDRAEPLLSVLQSAPRAMFRLVSIVMKAAPVGTFGAMAFTIGRYGLGSIASLALLVRTFYVTSILSSSSSWVPWRAGTASRSSPCSGT